MQTFGDIDALRSLCETHNKWGLYINIYVPDQLYDTAYGDGSYLDEIIKAASFLNFEEHGQIIIDEHGWFLFDTQEEMETAYWQCIGDDGPNENNPYNGPVSVYALTCDPTGQTMNENT